jgi:replicative DNA helicase
MGKTAFAFTMAAHAADMAGKHVLIFSLEMGGEALATRVLSMKTGIDAGRLKTGALTEVEGEQMADATDELEASPLHLVADSSVSFSQLRAIARKMKREGKLDMLMVDYVQLMSPDASSAKDNRERQISDISRGLKRLAMELNIPVLALSQLNRELERRQDKRPIPSDLRESGSLEQDADVIIMLYRDEVYSPGTAEKGAAEILVRKHRNGPVGDVKVRFDDTTASFVNARPLKMNYEAEAMSAAGDPVASKKRMTQRAA